MRTSEIQVPLQCDIVLLKEMFLAVRKNMLPPLFVKNSYFLYCSITEKGTSIP